MPMTKEHREMAAKHQTERIQKLEGCLTKLDVLKCMMQEMDVLSQRIDALEQPRQAMTAFGYIPLTKEQEEKLLEEIKAQHPRFNETHHKWATEALALIQASNNAATDDEDDPYARGWRVALRTLLSKMDYQRPKAHPEQTNPAEPGRS